ncbi:MAG: hypothetical protein OHK0012_05200 [Synechococcales cyanobacterium]
MTHGRRSPCPVACTLDLIGDRWTLLVIRDMMFFGKQRFEEFLDSPEGISTNILANRLKLLEEQGLAEKEPYGSHSRRMNYRLTEKGNSLRPVLKAVAVWGLRHVEATQVWNPAAQMDQDPLRLTDREQASEQARDQAAGINLSHPNTAPLP